MNSLKGYVKIWIFLSLLLSYEWFALNHAPNYSFLALLRANVDSLAQLNLSPEAGKPISYWAGWVGFGIMLLTNFYIFRKRLAFLKRVGNLNGWLNFHIFCGLLGPTFILFHTNFKIGGLVAISFWSMVVSFASGVVGRYFYLQLVAHKAEIEEAIRALEKQLELNQKQGFSSVSPEKLLQVKGQVLALAGIPMGQGAESWGVTRAFWASLIGDLRIYFKLKQITPGYSPQLRLQLKRIAILNRQNLFLEQFRRIMGYWHAFHMPFAVFMYVIAAIHIATALILKVPG